MEERTYSGSKVKNHFTAYLLGQIRGRRRDYLKKKIRTGSMEQLVDEFTQQEFDARDIEALKNSTSVAMAGTPLEDSETAKLVAEYEAFGVTYDAEKDQWYFNGEEVRYFRDVLTSNGESLTSGKFQGEMRTLGSGVGTIDIYTVRDYGHLNSEHHGTLTGIEKYSQEEFDEHTQAGMSGNQPIGNASHN